MPGDSPNGQMPPHRSMRHRGSGVAGGHLTPLPSNWHRYQVTSILTIEFLASIRHLAPSPLPCQELPQGYLCGMQVQAAGWELRLGSGMVSSTYLPCRTVWGQASPFVAHLTRHCSDSRADAQ